MFLLLSLMSLADSRAFHLEGSHFNLERKERILAGARVNIVDAPFMVYLSLQLRNGLKRRGFCSGFIISPRYVLTAGHCLSLFQDQSKTSVIITTGTDFLEAPALFENSINYEDHMAEQFYIHEKFKSKISDHTGSYDIGLIKLKEALKFGRLQHPITIVNPCYQIFNNTETVTVFGFGRAESIPGVLKGRALKSLNETLLDQVACSKVHFPDYDVSTVFCASPEKGGACKGDSGGPAVMDGNAIGIVSGGTDEITCLGIANAFTRLDLFYHWILDKMQEEDRSFIENSTISNNKIMNDKQLKTINCTIFN